MATTFKKVRSALVTATITQASLANSAGRVSTQIDLQDGNSQLPEEILVEWFFTNGTSPTSGNATELHQVWGDDEGTAHIDGGLAATDTGYTTGPPTASTIRSLGIEQLLAFVSGGTTGEAFKGSILVPVRARYWSGYVYNGSGVTANSTAGNFWLRVTPIYHSTT